LECELSSFSHKVRLKNKVGRISLTYTRANITSVLFYVFGGRGGRSWCRHWFLL